MVRQIRAELPKVQRTIAAGVDLHIVSDRTVTIRARDSMAQERISLDRVEEYVKERIG